LAETLYRLDKPESAIELYQEITDIDPKCMEAWLDWSFILFAQDKFDDAIAVLQTGIEQDPKNHLGHYRMACYLYAAGKTVQSKQFLETALSINPKDFYHIYEILPELQHVNDITALIELYTTNNEKL
jgi:tetratricopeptide (TPR) repeat protein